MNKVKWSCSDYLRDDRDKYCWLMNPQWKVRPTIAFKDGTMKFSTCKYHDGGYSRMMIHTCRWKHHLPSGKPDKDLQVVTQIIHFREGKASLYSTEWKIMEKYGSFGGLDTCNHVEFGDFEKHSIIVSYNEDKYIVNLYGVNTNLDVLFKKIYLKLNS